MAATVFRGLCTVPWLLPCSVVRGICSTTADAPGFRTLRDDGEGQNRPRAGKGGTERSRADGTDAPRGTGTGERGAGPPRHTPVTSRLPTSPLRSSQPRTNSSFSASVSPSQLPLLSSLPAPLPASPAPSVGGWGVAWWWLPCLPSSSPSSGDGARAPALLSPRLPFRRGRLVR
jgi:hypothetical protein